MQGDVDFFLMPKVLKEVLKEFKKWGYVVIIDSQLANGYPRVGVCAALRSLAARALAPQTLLA